MTTHWTESVIDTDASCELLKASRPQVQNALKGLCRLVGSGIPIGLQKHTVF